MAIQNGEPVANIRGIYTGNDLVLTESAVTGDFFGSTATMRLPLNLVPFGSDSVRGGVGDGTFFAPFQPLEDNGGFKSLKDILDPDALQQMEAQNREHFCSLTTNTCIGLRPEWNGDVNGNIISTNIDGAEATWIHGNNLESADERWQVILEQGWDDTGPPNDYSGPFSVWFYYPLSSNDITQGFVGFSEFNDFTYELSLQVPSGVTEGASEEQFLSTVDTFRGPGSQ